MYNSGGRSARTLDERWFYLPNTTLSLLPILPNIKPLLHRRHNLSILVDHGGVKDREVLLVVLFLFTQLLDGLVTDFKDCRHGDTKSISVKYLTAGSNLNGV